MDFLADMCRLALAIMPHQSTAVNDGDWEGVVTYLPRIVQGAVNHVPWDYRERLKSAVLKAIEEMP